MTPPLYSIRMHSTRRGSHLSGAERLIPAELLEEAAAAFVRRAMTHPRGEADLLSLSVEALAPEAIRRGRLPDLTTVRVRDYQQGRTVARHLLLESGVAPDAIDTALAALAAGPAPGGRSMRGAMLVDAASGARLEPDTARGVRASRMDLSPGAAADLRRELEQRGLDNLHVREALVLAAKVAATPGVVAELCWSDDPDYTAGYVCTPIHGYVRFPHLKPAGEERGGRAFFLAPGCDPASSIAFLENQPMVFEAVGVFHSDRDGEV